VGEEAVRRPLAARAARQVDAGKTVVVEHEMRVIAGSALVIDIGPGAREEGGRMVAADPSAMVARAAKIRIAPSLARVLSQARGKAQPSHDRIVGAPFNPGSAYGNRDLVGSTPP
jgi:hypothetical protein